MLPDSESHKGYVMSKSIAPWAGRILHVDLTAGVIDTLPTRPHAHDFLGGRGLAARLAWDLIKPGVSAFDDANPLMFVPGAMVGTPAPSSGRVSICGLSPQAYPHEWYTRSNLGGHWGAELKYAGYDGLVVTGRSPTPVYIHIQDDQVSLRDASHLWGLGIIETQRRLIAHLPTGTRILAIGPAGENRCRLAIIATGTESAAGQGGFGAVMGAKNLKAVAVRGHGGVPVARPAEALRRSRQVVQGILRIYKAAPPALRDDRPATSLRAPCTYQCPRSCGGFYEDVPGRVRDRTYTGHLHCSAPLLMGGVWPGVSYNFRAGFEIAQTCNSLGINHWEIIFGLVPWLLRCQARGELNTLNSERLDLRDPSVLLHLIEGIAYRRGPGAVFADGVPRAADALAVGQDLVGELYPAWGQASHWDGHGSYDSPFFPYWLVTGLQWALDTRDPLGGGHGYTTNIFRLVVRLEKQKDDPQVRQRLLTVGRRIYGTSSAADPLSAYEGKAAPAVFHQDRNALKDSLGICDNIFPMLTDDGAEDMLFSVDGIEGSSLEHYLFDPLSDQPYDRTSFYRVGTRVFALERLLAIRNWGRSRETDETIIAYLRHPETCVSPYQGATSDFDPDRFRTLLGECYALRGWDRATGMPSADSLRVLGLDGIAAG